MPIKLSRLPLVFLQQHAEQSDRESFRQRADAESGVALDGRVRVHVGNAVPASGDRVIFNDS